MIRFVFIFIFLLFYSGAVKANEDTGLYTLYSPDKSYVRIINPTLSDVSLNGTRLPETMVTPYYGLTTTTATIEDNVFPIKKGHFYSVIAKENSFILEDQRNDNPSKANLVLFNLSKENISLKTKNGIDVIAAVNPNQKKSRAINPVSVGFTLHMDEKKWADVPTFPIQNNQEYSIVVFSKNQVSVHTSTIDDLP